MPRLRLNKNAWIILGLALFLYGAKSLSSRFLAPAPEAERVETLQQSQVSEGEARIAAAFRAKRSGFFVEASGVVERTLPDDREGSRHQRFILRLPSGLTVLVAHNIDLAPRVPISNPSSSGCRGGITAAWFIHSTSTRSDPPSACAPNSSRVPNQSQTQRPVASW